MAQRLLGWTWRPGVRKHLARSAARESAAEYRGAAAIPPSSEIGADTTARSRRRTADIASFSTASYQSKITRRHLYGMLDPHSDQSEQRFLPLFLLLLPAFAADGQTPARCRQLTPGSAPCHHRRGFLFFRLPSSFLLSSSFFFTPSSVREQNGRNMPRRPQTCHYADAFAALLRLSPTR